MSLKMAALYRLRVSTAFEQPPCESTCDDDCGGNDCCCIELVRYSLPFRAYRVADSNEADYPQRAARVCVERERPRRETACACYQGGEVADAGDEVPEEECPFAKTVKPFVGLRQMASYVPFEHWHVVQSVDYAGTSQVIADGNAAGAACKCDQERGHEFHLAVVDGNACEDEDCLVRDQRAYDTQHKQAEKGKVAVMLQELVDVFYWLISSLMAAIAAAGSSALVT